MSSEKFEVLWPVTIELDRYGGAYSHGLWTAWNQNYIPEAAQSGDPECAEFWDNNPLCGKGNTPNEAYEDLLKKISKGGL